jgi:hypothetical protein
MRDFHPDHHTSVSTLRRPGDYLYSVLFGGELPLREIRRNRPSRVGNSFGPTLLPIPAMGARHGPCAQWTGTSYGGEYDSEQQPPTTFSYEALIEVVRTNGTYTSDICQYVEYNNAGTADRRLNIGVSGNVIFYIYAGGSVTLTSSTAFANGSFLHIVISATSGNYKMYVNGVQEATSAAGAAYTGYTNPKLAVGKTFGATQEASKVYYLNVLRYNMTQAEAIERAENPFRFLKLPQRPSRNSLVESFPVGLYARKRQHLNLVRR